MFHIAPDMMADLTNRAFDGTFLNAEAVMSVADLVPFSINLLRTRNENHVLAWLGVHDSFARDVGQVYSLASQAMIWNTPHCRASKE